MIEISYNQKYYLTIITGTSDVSSYVILSEIGSINLLIAPKILLPKLVYIHQIFQLGDFNPLDTRFLKSIDHI